VQPLPAHADAAQIVEALRKLRSAKLLAGFRGALPADIEAVAHVVMAIGRLMQIVPDRRQSTDGAPQGTRSDRLGCADRCLSVACA
jgi:hypothetical protein